MSDTEPRAPSEVAAQHAINAAAAEAATEYFRRLKLLPRWRAWLVRRLAPAYPMVRAELPPIDVIITRPLEVAPGVVLAGKDCER
jgi:hypothetical protein